MLRDRETDLGCPGSAGLSLHGKGRRSLDHPERMTAGQRTGCPFLNHLSQNWLDQFPRIASSVTANLSCSTAPPALRADHARNVEYINQTVS